MLTTIKARVRQTGRVVIDLALQRRQLHFLHIGKTGGTAVKEALAEQNVPKYRLHLHGHDVALEHVRAKERVFFFLRDPSSRFTSGFYSRQRKGRPRYDYPWTREESKAFAIFPTANDLAEALSSPLREQALEAMLSIRHVRSHIAWWLGSVGYLKERIDDLFFVGFLETFSADTKELFSKLGIKAELPTDDISTHSNPPHVDMTLSDEAMRNLSVWYGEDFQLYDYAREIAEQVNSRKPA